MAVGPPAPALLARGPWEPGRVRASWREHPYQPGAAATKAADAAVQELRDRGSPAHDGLSARLAGYDTSDGGLSLELEPARWALRLIGEGADSIAALCVVRDSEGRWLAGRRAPWVATWAGRWALGAGGAVDVGENPADTLGRELMEEWSVRPERLTVEALVRIPSGLVLMVGMATLAPGAQVTIDPEHDAFAWWPSEPDDWPAEADEPLRRMGGLLGS